MIPAQPERNPIPLGIERPEPLRATPPSPASLWDELEAIRRLVRDLERRVDALEAKVRELGAPKHEHP